MDSRILLENGTNELEVLEFTLGGNSYGINVAKIREIITYQEVTPVPNAHPSIEGIFMPRDTMITAIDLKNCLQMGTASAGGLFIVTNFNKLDIAFHVDSVVGIHRVSWTDIIRPDATVTNKADGVSTGIIKVNGKLIIILDSDLHVDMYELGMHKTLTKDLTVVVKATDGDEKVYEIKDNFLRTPEIILNDGGKVSISEISITINSTYSDVGGIYGIRLK